MAADYRPESSYSWTLCRAWLCLNVTNSHKVDLNTGIGLGTGSRSLWWVHTWLTKYNSNTVRYKIQNTSIEQSIKHHNLYGTWLLEYNIGFICNTVTSNWAKVIHGVPHDSILGPLLFLHFINDLPMFAREKLVPILFADDTSILISHSNLFDFKNEIKTLFISLNSGLKIICFLWIFLKHNL